MVEVMDLNGEWELHPVAEFSNLWLGEEAPAEGWFTQEIPAHWQEHPALQEHSGKMLYRKSFSLKPLKNHIYRLETGGVFYRFRAYVNKFALGRAEGYFVPAGFDLTPYLREENLLVLEVDSPQEDTAVLTGLFAGYPGIPRSYNPGGLWQPVRILRSGPAYLQDWILRTEIIRGEKTVFFLQAQIFSSRPAAVELVISLTPHNFSAAPLERKFAVSLHAGVNVFMQRFQLEGVKPWWTWDLGEPNLYRAEIRLQNGGTVWDKKSELFGARTFAMQNFLCYLNGKRILLKGGNYLPPGIYPARAAKDRYREDFSLVKKSNQNMVRCYRHVGVQDFYRAAGEAGVLVWQDFPLNPVYPAERADGALAQLQEFSRTPGRHTAVAVWSVVNITGFELGTAAKLRPGLRLLAEKLAKKLREIDPSRPVVAVSGHRSLFFSSDTGFGCGVAPGEKDLHRLDRYRTGIARKHIRFVSWFGAPSFPVNSTVSPGQGETVEWKKVPREILFLFGRKQKNITPAELAAASQEKQAEILRFYIDRLRFQKYNPTGGMLFFCLRDLVPGPFWSIVEHGGAPKASFDTLALCYRPVYVFALFSKAFYHVRDLLYVPVCFSSDRHDPAGSSVQVKARLTDPRRRLVWKDQWSVTPQADEKTRVLGHISVLLMEKGAYTLELVWEDGETVENVYKIEVL